MELSVNGNMLVIGSQAVKVELSKREQLDIAVAVIKREFSLANSRDYYHYLDEKTGKLMLCTDYGHHRGGEEREEVRDATDDDKAALRIMAALENRRLHEL